jgi:dTDP-4-dehydrorhamnose 3,5-epimerase
MPFNFKTLKIPEVILIEPKKFLDERGFFFESFKNSDFILNGICSTFVQDNFSHSIKGVLRGLHFQNNNKSQAKLVSVTRGEIFDVAVDIRKNSPTYGKWVSEILSETNRHSLYLPDGFAHGFCVLSNEADVVYKVSNEYSSEHDSGVMWNDPDIGITWPIKNPIMSEKDLILPSLQNIDSNFVY